MYSYLFLNNTCTVKCGQFLYTVLFNNCGIFDNSLPHKYHSHYMDFSNTLFKASGMTGLQN